MSPSVALSLTLSIQLKALTRGWRRQNREFQEKSRHVSIRKVTVLNDRRYARLPSSDRVASLWSIPLGTHRRQHKERHVAS